MLNYNGFISDKSSENYQNRRIEGEIVDLFDQTANIVLNNQFPSLLTIGSSVILGSPNSLSFPMFDQIRPQLKRGDSLLLIEGKVLQHRAFHGLLQVVTEERLNPPWEVVDQKRLSDLKRTINDWDVQQKYPGVMPFYQQLEKEIIRFKKNFLKEEKAAIQTSVQRLLGLGLGLTPSGDDFLTGLLLVFCEETTDNENLRTIIQEQWHRTNRISQHQLYFATKGRGKRSLLQVVRGIGQATDPLLDFENAVAETLSVGSTSGHDLLLGVLTGFDLWHKKGEERK